MAKLELSVEELSELVVEVLERLARDPEAKHLWHWTPRPRCDDEPFGRSRRNHLGALLGLVGAAVLPSVPGCGCADDPCSCGDDPCAGDAGSDAGGTCGDDPCAADAGSDAGGTCGDDPCAADAGHDAGPVVCADDPCAADAGRDAGPVVCADDPCACADDPCACADDPC